MLALMSVAELQVRREGKGREDGEGRGGKDKE